ncbi:ATP-binding protein [Candidatus Parcubacteria bacterium]|nr:MAG: ATP-binding protein [Candidatus Parcubacteria bacterium]
MGFENAEEKEGRETKKLGDFLGGQEKGDRWELPTDMDVVDPATDEFEERLKRAGCTPEEIDHLSLSFREMLINGMAHGNMGIPEINEGEDLKARATQELLQKSTAKKVFVALTVSKNLVKVTVEDQGEGFDWRNIPDPSAEENVLKTHGRGIFLIRYRLEKLGGSVAFNKKGNEISIALERK